MEAVWANISSSFTQMMGWELVAVLLAVAYLLLAMRENIYCWHCALISTAIYTVLFWNVSLLMDSGLNVYYMAMAVYGWWQWTRGGRSGEGVAVHTWSIRKHAIAWVVIAGATLVSGYLLSNNTQAAWPYLDSFTTWASVFTTWLVAQKVLENWLYWIVIDAVSIFLYLDRGLYLTAILFAAYVVICVFGYLQWRAQLQPEQKAVSVTG